MTPTTKLRFLERKVAMHPFYRDMSTGGRAYQTYQVLQQWWEDEKGDLERGVTVYGEWRDVPLEQGEA